MTAPNSPAPASNRLRSNRKLLLVVLGVVAIAAIAAGGYGLWYVLIGPSAPAAVAGAVIPAGAEPGTANQYGIVATLEVAVPLTCRYP